MHTPIPENITRVIDRVVKAGNQHDLPAMLSCFAVDYQSTPPNHPDRIFQGRAQVGKNWSAMFEEIPNFQEEILDMAVSGNQVWTEWHWWAHSKMIRSSTGRGYHLYR